MNYNNYPIAYVKNGKLRFFNPDNKSNVEFTEETDPVFQCAYSKTDAMFHYTVVQNGMLVLKKADLSVVPVKISTLIKLNKPATEFISQTNNEKSKLSIEKNNILIEYDFVWEYYSFTKFIGYVPEKNMLSVIDWEQFESKYGYHPRAGVEADKNYHSIYDKILKLDLSAYDDAETSDSENEIIFVDASADGSKIALAVMLHMVDLPHGPYCIANSDGTKITILEQTDMGNLAQTFVVQHQSCLHATLSKRIA